MWKTRMMTGTNRKANDVVKMIKFRREIVRSNIVTEMRQVFEFIPNPKIRYEKEGKKFNESCGCIETYRW